MLTEQESFSLVLEVPLKKNGDYDRENIKYSPEYPWIEEDQEKIENVINEFFNSYEKTGQKKVITSVGEVIIKHEEHPQVARRKLIQGFLKQETLPPASPSPAQTWELLTVLKDSIPETLKNNQEAIKYLQILEMLVNPYEKNSENSKSRLFDSILQILAEHKDEYTEDENAAGRLSKVVDNLRKLYPNC